MQITDSSDQCIENYAVSDFVNYANDVISSYQKGTSLLIEMRSDYEKDVVRYNDSARNYLIILGL